jgi:S-layer protein (TIGR01567 family)
VTVKIEQDSQKDLFLEETKMGRSVSTVIVGLVLTIALSSCAAAEIRGEVTDLGIDTFTWNCKNFGGFYYDLDTNICTEKLTFVLSHVREDRSSASLLGDAPYGIKYETCTYSKNLKFKPWGTYNVIGFMAEKYFAGYNPGSDSGSNIFYSRSTDKNSLSSGQLEKILMDDDFEMTVTSDKPLKLEEGYELAIKSIDIEGKKVYLELSKNGATLDSKVISPSRDGAIEIDKTYYYKNPAVGDQKKLITIGVHFKNAFSDADQDLAVIDGVWQISDTPAEVKADAQFGKMTVSAVDAYSGTIIMDNKDNSLTLSNNKDIALMGGIKIKTSDQDDISAENPLRYCIYVD